MSVDITAVSDAARRIADCVHRTPVMTSASIDAVAGCELMFKCENLQKSGAFKARGAHNAVLSLDSRARAAGVATHSSGNHGAALALAARRVSVPAFIVMPETSSAVKVSAVRAYGGEITFCGPGQAEREAALGELCRRTGAVFIPPYDHPHIIAGQGTCALELSEQLPRPPDALIAPVGGGGLLSGSAVVSRSLWPDTAVIGAEPAGADDARRSLLSGRRQPQPAPRTIADGLRTALGEHTFALIREHVDDILTVGDSGIVDAMRLIMTRMKLVVEPSAAVALAVVLNDRERFAGRRVAVIVSGGNVDLDALPWS